MTPGEKGVLDLLVDLGGFAGLAALITVVVMLLDARNKRITAEGGEKKDTGDAAESLSTAVVSLIGPLTGRVDALEKEVQQLREENADLRDWAERLVTQVKGLGAEPVKLRTKRPATL